MDPVADPPPDLPAPPADPLVDHLPVAVLAFDRRDRIVGWNPAAADLYGLPAEHAVGQSVLLFVPHPALADFARAAEAVRAAGRWAGLLPTQTATGRPVLADARWAAGPGGLTVAVHADATARLTRDDQASRAGRWAMVRRLARATAADPAPAGPLARWAADPDPAADPVYRGAGEWVLVACGRRLVRELTAALLDAAGYTVVTATDRAAAGWAAAHHKDRLRAAVVGLGSDTAAAAADVRGLRPLLPLVGLGPGGDDLPADGPTGYVADPHDPSTLLAAVAAAVADDYLADATLFGDGA